MSRPSTDSQAPPPYAREVEMLGIATTSVTNLEQRRPEDIISEVIHPSHQRPTQSDPFSDNAAMAPPESRAVRRGSGYDSHHTSSPMPEGPTTPQNYGIRPSQVPSAPPPPPNWLSFPNERQSLDSRAPASRSNSGHTSFAGNSPMVASTPTPSITPLFDQYSTTSLNSAVPARTSSPTPNSVAPVTYSPKPAETKAIYFYDRDKPYYEFTNFSPNPVMYEGKEYPTSEHLFQAMKFMPKRPLLAEHIRTYSNNPRDAFTEARRFQPEWDPKWHSVKIQRMDDILYLKFTSTKTLRNLLTKTGNAVLLEDSPVDDFWGIGIDHKGKNELGLALMRLRTKLQATPAPSGLGRFW